MFDFVVIFVTDLIVVVFYLIAIACLSSPVTFFKLCTNSCCNDVRCIDDIVSVFSGTSVPGIAEYGDGTVDADVHASSTVKFRGKIDLIIHKGKSLGKATTLHIFGFAMAIVFGFASSLLWDLL